MEVVSFDDTIREIENVVVSSLPRIRIILVISIAMYIDIKEYGESVMANEVEVNTKYNNIDKKMKPMVVPLPKDSSQRMKEVATNLSLRDPKSIGHTFTEETRERSSKLVGMGSFYMKRSQSLGGYWRDMEWLLLSLHKR